MTELRRVTGLMRRSTGRLSELREESAHKQKKGETEAVKGGDRVKVVFDGWGGWETTRDMISTISMS